MKKRIFLFTLIMIMISIGFSSQAFGESFQEESKNSAFNKAGIENNEQSDEKVIHKNSASHKTPQESSTSKLGHIRNASAKIYKSIGDETTSIQAGSKYTGKVYYIKKQAKLNGKTYYLISTVASASKGVIGWVKSEDIWAQEHVAVDHKNKTLYLKGTGWAYTDAWGSTKDVIYNDLRPFKNQEFKVNLTEKVGDAIWYRGFLNGKKVWIQAYNVISPQESSTSKLGHIRNASAKIYKSIGDETTSIQAGSKYTGKVYYIKKQAKLNGKTYYLISTVASASKGVIGWVKSEDIWAQEHVAVDHKNKTLYLKGTGWAYTDAWGSTKDVIYNDLRPFKNQEFKVNLTEKVGDAIWYRGFLNGKKVWIQAYNVTPINEWYSNYNLTLNKMIDIQMAASPKTDKSYKLWIREDAFATISGGRGLVKSNTNWNLRRGPSVTYSVGEIVSGGTSLPLYSSAKGSDGYTWYHVKNTVGWVTPDKKDTAYYLNPNNFLNSLKEKMQFLSLSKSANIDINEVNEKILKGKGILEGRAQAFVEGAKLYGINEIYLIAHALLETGNGTSKLATGVKHNGKTVYNMYGIGAKDSCPLECGKSYAYSQGWFTPELAIKGGAKFVAENYISVGQDTLYKMRWNPSFAAKNGYAYHQYATDIGWAYKQTKRMYDIYILLDSYTLIFDIPKYR
ncbi:N-acetylglucosaminidase [Virgibacillus proomii]|uniref:N-acetylglucosaminidase n=1 Tax=Virgibacillus proomii TaxID=84407 RepID=UPI001C1128E4|nr:N-acetylglucosaminidase [Virgibacillus proomii]MBU5268071.1 N-acetylglucosaminidase [Virgibacillus proomii]